MEADLLAEAGQIVDLAVGQEDRAADAAGRDIRNGGGKRGEEPGGGRFRGAVVLDLDDTRLDARKAREALLEPGQGAVRPRAAAHRPLALRAVDDQRPARREVFPTFPGPPTGL